MARAPRANPRSVGGPNRGHVRRGNDLGHDIRIENGKQPYGQALLEALAAALNCEPADIIRRPPGIEDEIRLVWSQLSPEKQKQAIDIIKVLKEGAA